MKTKNRTLPIVIFTQLVLLFGLLIWLWIRRYSQEGRVRTPRLEIDLIKQAPPPKKPEGEIAEPKTPRAEKPTPARRQVGKSDDLKLIEGVGPKIASTLQEAGIKTFKQLARARPQRLQKILNEASIPIADPSTWPEQAALAAAGDWDALVELKATLKGGRRVD